MIRMVKKRRENRLWFLRAGLGKHMEDLRKIWYDAREIIRPQLTGVTFHRWIDSLDPVVV